MGTVSSPAYLPRRRRGWRHRLDQYPRRFAGNPQAAPRRDARADRRRARGELPDLRHRYQGCPGCRIPCTHCRLLLVRSPAGPRPPSPQGWSAGQLAGRVGGGGTLAVRAGADMVSAQGVEAGGHCRGDSPLLPLLCEVLDAVDVPVLAAGGIADARGVAAALAAGASGVRMGTRFIATEESGAHPDYVAAILAAGANSTRITDAFNDCPLCASSPRARVLISAIDAVEAIDVEVVGTMPSADGEMPVPRRSWIPPTRGMSGHIEAMCMYAGESVALVNTVLPASRLVRSLAEGAEALLKTAQLN